MPTATAAAQTITVGTNDKVTAIKTLGTGTAAAQTITVGTNDRVAALTDITLTATKGDGSTVPVQIATNTGGDN